MIHRNPRSYLCLATLAAFAIANAASGAQLGMTFIRGTNAAGTAGAEFANVQNGLPNSLATSTSAGVAPYTQTNWNNLATRGTNIVLTDSAGAASGVTVNWVATGTWSLGGSLPTDVGSGDGNLMQSYLDSNGATNSALLPNLFAHAPTNPPAGNLPMIYLSGLSAWMTAQSVSYYDVVIYMDGDNAAGRVGEYWIQNASGPADNLVYGADLTTHTFIRDFNNFSSNPVYQQVPLTSDRPRAAASGNYLVFPSLSADTLLVRAAEFLNGSGTPRSPINAIQIIPRATAVGATIDPPPTSRTYTGGRATFRAKTAGVLPMTFQWQKGGVPLSDGGNISGSATATLNINSVSGGDAGDYALVVSNANGVVTSTVAPLTVVSPAADSYANKVFTNGPVAYWRFNEVVDPSTNNSAASDSVGGFTAIYGAVSQNGYNSIAGPRPSDFPGFESDNAAMQTTFANPASVPYPSAYVSWAIAPALNLNTNTVTMCAWIYPIGNQAGSAALIFQRTNAPAGVNDTSGFGYGGNNTLGYTWNNTNNTFGFGPGSPGYPDNGLVPPSNQWSFVACVITPTNAILYLFNTNGQYSATNNVAHANGLWGNETMIGDDPNSITVPQNRAFNGVIDEVAVFNRSLTGAELGDLYKKGLGVSALPPVITVQPLPLALMAGRTARFSVLASGDAPLTYQWRTNGVNLSDGGNVAGAASPALTVSPVGLTDAADYDVVISNGAGSITSSVANLSVIVSNATPIPYEARLRGANPIAYWRFNEAAGGTNSYDYWGGNILANTNVALGVPGPIPPEYSGVEPSNTGAQFDSGQNSSAASSVRMMNNLFQFSIVGWFRIPGGNWPVGQRVGLFGQNDVMEFGYHGNGTDGMPQIGIFTPRGSVFLNQSTNVLPDTWYLIAAVGTSTNLNLYLASTNGAGGIKVVQNTVNHNASVHYGASLFPFRVGGGGILDVTGNFLSGFVDEVAVFNRAISSSEFSDLFGAAFSGGDLPPTISAEPVSQTLYAGRTATFTVTAVGTSPQYRWRKGGVPLSDGGNISGATTPTLTITNVSAANEGVYEVLITNRVASITSAPVSLTVITPTPGSFEAALIGLNPVAYYRLNETNDPSGGIAPANDFWGGHNGTYGVAAQNAFNGIAGPTNPPYVGFGTVNGALRPTLNTAESWVTASPLGISTNVLTIIAWVNPATYVDRAGFVFYRAGQAATGINFIGAGNLNYHWLDNAATYNWDSGLNVPLNQWSMVVLVAEANQGTMYLVNANGMLSAVNPVANAVRAFTDNVRIGGDPNNVNRTFDGTIDEVAIFSYALTAGQIQQLYNAAVGITPVSLTIQQLGGNVILTWPQGKLLEADEVTGPWTTNQAATSPYTNAPSAARKFYRVQVQ
jgi:hypothetical protein